MKIIAVDNLARETVADTLVIGWIPDADVNRSKAQEFCDWLNDFSCHDNGGSYYRIADNDYKLWRGMEELI